MNEPLVVVKLDQRRASLVRICLFQIFGASQHRVTLDSPNSFVLALMYNQKISFCNVSLCYLYLDLFVFFLTNVQILIFFFYGTLCPSVRDCYYISRGNYEERENN